MERKIALVTGGTSGIGKEIACELAKNSIKVCISYSRSDEDAEQALKELRSISDNIFLYKADVSDDDSVKKMFFGIDALHGRLDYLINNAGIDIPQPIETYNLEDWNKIIGVNLTGKFICIKHAIPLLSKSEDARIINMASRFGKKPRGLLSAYCCSEAGVIMLTKVAALELSKYKIKVNAICPGMTKTPLTEKLNPDQQIWKDAARANPMGRVASTKDIADAVMLLLSDGARYINGESILVDGGSTLV